MDTYPLIAENLEWLVPLAGFLIPGSWAFGWFLGLYKRDHEHESVKAEVIKLRALEEECERLKTENAAFLRSLPGHHNVIVLTADELVMLEFAAKNDFAPKVFTEVKIKMLIGKLRRKSLISTGPGGHHVSQLGLEELERNGLIK